MSGRVHQEDETKLKGTVTQAAKDRTITGTATITPSGDMARKAYYDRDSSLINEYYHVSTTAAHSATVRWTYTVPADRKAIHSVLFGQVYRDIVGAGKTAQAIWQSLIYGGSWYDFMLVLHTVANGFSTAQGLTATFALNEGDAVRGQTSSNSEANNGYTIASLLTEFDV